MDLQAAAQSRTDVFLKKLFRNEKDTLLQHVLSHPETYRYQLIYTQIDRDEKKQTRVYEFLLSIRFSTLFQSSIYCKIAPGDVDIGKTSQP